MAKISLTKRQNDIFDFIKNRIKSVEVPPTIKEICDEFGIKSTNAVYEVLKVLEKKGFIDRGDKGISRGIRLRHDAKVSNDVSEFQSNIRQINIIGSGEEGNPLSFFLNSKGTVCIDSNFFKIDSGNFFAHLLEDNGMAKDGLFEGDLALVAQGKSVDSGQWVAAQTGAKVIIRKIERYSDGDELLASSRGFPKIKMKKGDKSIKIIGKVVGFLKKV